MARLNMFNRWRVVKAFGLKGAVSMKFVMFNTYADASSSPNSPSRFWTKKTYAL